MIALAESIQPDAFNNHLLKHVPITALQRLGYLLEQVFDNQPLANALCQALQENEFPLFRIPLKASAVAKGFVKRTMESNCEHSNRFRTIVRCTITVIKQQMATNKLAFIRHQTLDKCFPNPGHTYYIEDLVKVCSNAIFSSSEKKITHLI